MLITLDGRETLQRQVYRAVRAQILAGQLGPGTRLPTTRGLSEQLGVSRNTVVAAYRQLTDEGYAVARTGSGSFVANTLPEQHLEGISAQLLGEAASDGSQAGPDTAEPSTPLSTRARRIGAVAPRRLGWEMPRHPVEIDFRYGEPGFADVPLETWWRLTARRARRATARQLGYGPRAGAPELQRALAGYLARARGVRCTPGQVLIVHGTQQAIDLTIRTLVDPGDPVAVEEPGYFGITYALLAHGARVRLIAVDPQGMPFDGLVAAGAVRGIFVTPSHQFPTGGILPLRRRLALLEHAAHMGAFVFEDDYDGEYRYDGRPIESLQGLDPAGRVLYAGSASKLLFPALRIGWLVVPEELVDPFQQAKALCDTGSPGLDQLVLADFIEEGHLERYIRRARLCHAARREALAEAVARYLGEAAHLEGTGAGVHGLLWLPDVPADRQAEVRRACARRSVGVYPVRPHYRNPPPRAGFVLGFAGLEPPAITEGIARLAQAIDEVMGHA
ncbi:MAG: PLP-dependent aminotransferase family protein [Myxococcales bacterium]|nr:PLP-dependent aminotransferase family protein [Myxococcales bacterium]